MALLPPSSTVMSATPEGTSEVRTTYDEDVTGRIGYGLKEQAVRAAHSIRSRFAGVDIITKDLAIPLEESGGVINEINTTPGLHNHYHLSGGMENHSPPAVPVLRYLLGIPRTLTDPYQNCSEGT